MRWALVGCLLGGAIAVGWPSGTVTRRRPLAALVRSWAGRVRAGLMSAEPGRVSVGAVVVTSALGLVTGGPVAAAVAAVYAGLAGRALIKRSAGRRLVVARTAALDELAALAADLRAGLPPAAARPTFGPAAGRIEALISAVWRLAEETGAPAADLVERIEADARAADRARSAAAAQAAGSQTTALLLALLPVAGIGLGTVMGADPVQVLLRTSPGAACAVVAVLLQGGGLLWTERLVAT